MNGSTKDGESAPGTEGASSIGALPSPLRKSAIVETARGTRFVRDVRVLGIVNSTLDIVADLARRGAPDGLVVVADAQWNGRGRRGGVWASSPGSGLFLSVLIRPAPDGRTAPLVAGAVGLAAAEAVRKTTGLDARLKWPNDVWVEGRKVGGVLIETTGGEDGYAAVGVGLTLTSPRTDEAPAGVAPLAGLTALVDRAPSREDLAVAFLDALEERLNAVAADPERLRAEYRDRDALSGLRVVLELPEGPVGGVVRDADLIDGIELELPNGARLRVRAALAHVASVVREP